MSKVAVMLMVAVSFGLLTSCAKKQTVKPEVEDFVSEADEPGIRGKTFQKVNEIKTINFDYDKSELRQDARNTLKANADYLKKNTDLEALVEGHCDERGSAEYNMALGQRRASSVRSYYIQMGVSADRISTISYGEERPVDPASSETAWAKNRRAETLVRSR